MTENNSNENFLERVAKLNTFKDSLNLLKEMNKDLQNVCYKSQAGAEIFGFKDVLEMYENVAKKTEEFAVKERKIEDPEFNKEKKKYIEDTKGLSYSHTFGLIN